MIITDLLPYIARGLVELVWDVYRRPALLGAAILGFTGTGLGMIIGSHAVAGWWQSALLGFGTGLVFTGTVELGIVGLINRIIGPNDKPTPPREPKIVITIGDETGTVVPRSSYGTAANPLEVAAILRELAGGLERGAAGG